MPNSNFQKEKQNKQRSTPLLKPREVANYISTISPLGFLCFFPSYGVGSYQVEHGRRTLKKRYLLISKNWNGNKFVISFLMFE